MALDCSRNKLDIERVGQDSGEMQPHRGHGIFVVFYCLHFIVIKLADTAVEWTISRKTSPVGTLP